MSRRSLTRRRFIQGLGVATAGTVLSACAPEIVKETVIVEKLVKETVIVDRPVEKIVKETVIVEASPQVVEKVITSGAGPKAVVSIAKIEGGDIDGAVAQAIDLLGGIETVMAGKQSILLKPNLYMDFKGNTTNPKVVRALAAMMRSAGKEVLIGEGSGIVPHFTMASDVASFSHEKTWRVNDRAVLDAMQEHVFEYTKYTPISEEMGIPLINLHTGDMAEVDVPGGLLFDQISLNRSLAEVDMVCSVPCMKVHNLTGVSLGMKNMMGAYPGSVYYTPRALVHEQCATVDPSGTHPAIVDIVRAANTGLTVVDGLFGWEFNESHGEVQSRGGIPIDWAFVGVATKMVPLMLIIAGANPLATDMVTASIMGFDPSEVGTFEWAWKVGMEPRGLDEIEVRGETIDSVKREFVRHPIVAYDELRELKGWQSFLEHTEKW